MTTVLFTVSTDFCFTETKIFFIQPQNKLLPVSWPDSVWSEIWIDSEYSGVLRKDKWKDREGDPKIVHMDN